MTEIPKISAAEWEVLHVVWERAPVTGPEVFDALNGEQEWHYKTVQTFLNRLVDKGVLAVERDGRVNSYTPLLKREACIRQESDSFLQRIFRGASGALLAHFCEGADLSDEEADELLKKLKARKREGGK